MTLSSPEGDDFLAGELWDAICDWDRLSREDRMRIIDVVTETCREYRQTKGAIPLWLEALVRELLVVVQRNLNRESVDRLPCDVGRSDWVDLPPAL